MRTKTYGRQGKQASRIVNIHSRKDITAFYEVKATEIEQFENQEKILKKSRRLFIDTEFPPDKKVFTDKNLSDLAKRCNVDFNKIVWNNPHKLKNNFCILPTTEEIKAEFIDRGALPHYAFFSALSLLASR